MLANRLRPIDQLRIAHCRRPQCASNAIEPLFLLVLWQEMSAAQRRKGISREAVNCAYMYRFVPMKILLPDLAIRAFAGFKLIPQKPDIATEPRSPNVITGFLKQRE
jgi:hypothetical protein